MLKYSLITLCLSLAVAAPAAAQTPAKQNWHTLPGVQGVALAWTIDAPRGNSGNLLVLTRNGQHLSLLTTVRVDCQTKRFRALSQVGYGADFKEVQRTPPGQQGAEVSFDSIELPVVAQIPTEGYAVALVAQFQCGVTQPDALRQMAMADKGMQADVDGAQRWLDEIITPQVAAAPAPTRADARRMLVGAWESTITAGGMIPLNQKIDVKMGGGGVPEAVRITKKKGTLKFTVFDVIDGEVHAQIDEGGKPPMTTYCAGKLNSGGTQITGSCYAETYQDGKATLYDSDQPWKATKVK